MTLNVTLADVREARRLLAKLGEAFEMIHVAKACKLDCTEDEAACQQAKEFLVEFLEIFGPKFPKG